jgi:formyltetrahydrofolate synthetase
MIILKLFIEERKIEIKREIDKKERDVEDIEGENLTSKSMVHKRNKSFTIHKLTFTNELINFIVRSYEI